jgi:hypothetical protein
MSTKHAKLTRESLAKLATVTLRCEPEDVEIEGNASAISPEEDAKTYAWIRDQLARGNEWAWCYVVATVEYDGLTATDSLSCCSYDSEADFRRPGGYYDDMVRNCLDDLWRQLELRTPAGRAKALALSSRQAIVTTFRGPTGGSRCAGARIIAKCEAKRISVVWDDDLDTGPNHAAAAYQLMDQLGWSERNDLVMGGTRDGYVFVQVPKRV